MRITFEANLLLHLTFILTFLILGALSKIFGTVKKSRPFYRLHYIAAGLCLLPILVGLASALMGVKLPIEKHMFYITSFCDLLALTLGAYATYFYWSWLPGQLRR